MSKCFHCGKSGIFVKLNQYGLCKDCATLPQTDAETGLCFSEQEQEFVVSHSNGMWLSGAEKKPKRIIDMRFGELHAAAGTAISAKEYELAKKLMQLSEHRADNIVDLHFCYNGWIDCLYKQREIPACLDLCMVYCKKDIALFPQLKKDAFFKGHETHIPSFERLAIIYEKQGDYENAVKINHMALSYKTIMYHDKYEKRLEKVKKKLTH